MTRAADIIAVGSGHNGLIAAAYLAAAGRQVLVLERNAWFGGGVVSRELTLPGFRHDQHSMSHIFIQGNPLLKNDDLQLKARHGLEYLFPDVPMMSVFEDGATLKLHRDPAKSAASIAKFSRQDAEAFMRVSRQAAAWLPMIESSLYSPPAPVGATHALLDQSREGRALWRVMQMSTHDHLCELFEHERVRMHFARVAGENLVSPDEKSTAIGMYVFLGFLEHYGFGVARGGAGRLTEALVACIRACGGEVIAGAEVARIRVSQGRATGVECVDGRTFSARDAVIGAIHPHLLGGMIDGLDAAVRAGAEAAQITDAACITVHAALDAPLRFRTADTVDAVMVELLPTEYETLRRDFDELRYGQFLPCPLLGLGSLSQFDAARVPPGKAILHLWDYVPYRRPDGRSWDAAKQEYADRMLAQLAKFVANIPEVVLARHVDSPLDMERTSPSFRRGDLHGVATTTYQSGAHRPTPELGQYTVPGLEGFYLVGPFQHPGGGVFGAGRATAMKVFEALGLDFERHGRVR
ncbi:MAG: NAD(P)/FAD-dependent oxidoreductase [Gammaproteobacteria bacterium]|nr:NAD(P)/FAD-dependent oxidoreductase [Gammaproteobacteria bacterium]